MNCIFCNIVSKKVPAKLVYEDSKILAFHDVNPVVSVHILIIPKKHIESAMHLKKEDEQLIGYIFLKIKDIAKNFGCDNGYRIVNNCGKDGGQTVNHLHFHLLGGNSLSWPPG
ncbi:MAG: histidine triad nucleotide-binding protein [Oscillospiraceae bacterium]|jgi:histidine triad (HIT) family protein|nr:histidine triad nucleotide-binding protein [Oscillospiraceae bacterium]